MVSGNRCIRNIATLEVQVGYFWGTGVLYWVVFMELLKSSYCWFISHEDSPDQAYFAPVELITVQLPTDI